MIEGGNYNADKRRERRHRGRLLAAASKDHRYNAGYKRITLSNFHTSQLIFNFWEALKWVEESPPTRVLDAKKGALAVGISWVRRLLLNS
jgi:hypothetical protein